MVAFRSDAPNLALGDANNKNDIFVRDGLFIPPRIVTVGAGQRVPGIDFGNFTQSDLAISMTDSADPTSVGQELSYLIHAFNSGPGQATHVTLTDPLPAFAIFVSAAVTDGTCTQSAGIVTCTTDNLASTGQGLIYRITIRPTLVRTVTNTASVRADQIDPRPADNTTAQTTRVGAPTPAGSNVVVIADPVKVTFANVSSAGLTMVTRTSPANVGTLPGRLSVLDNMAFQITATASAHRLQ